MRRFGGVLVEEPLQERGEENMFGRKGKVGCYTVTVKSRAAHRILQSCGRGPQGTLHWMLVVPKGGRVLVNPGDSHPRVPSADS